MSMTDPLADMLTRIRNGQQAGLYTINSPFSKLREGVLAVLKAEGYITDYERVDTDPVKPELKIVLRYENGRPVIKELNRISKPGRRVYYAISKLKKFYNGLGVIILSTSKGVISDYEARKHNVGGEVLCSVF